MIVVYSALFGSYDKVPSAPYGGVLFTDQRISPQGWEVRRTGLPYPDPRYASRWYFSQSTRALPEVEYTVMHGANAQMKMDPAALVQHLPLDVDIGLWRHAHRRTVWQEAGACIKLGKDDPQVIRAQMERYKAEGFPGNELSTCVILVRRNTPALAAFESFWWNEVKNGSVRDQLSFDYARWKTGTPVHFFNGQIKRGHVLKVSRHHGQ